ncbi:cell wall-binding repeat-containing protein [Desulfosporosinus sp. BICA1-9]|uniref:cell wall-binding repeat-containing protein n=1 Tax=Desulfosporosinus sp. BICA1-9 TaxID=1531958 RepID=UPI0025BCA0F6|nr:cell wall-binding repeat-containing protein [Desulfosporosinus sp. BICA1-9]
MKKSSYRHVLLLISLSACLVLQPLFVFASQATNQLERLYGNTRFQTMAQIALMFPGIVDNVVLTTGSNFPDALAGVPLAHQKQGPLLLLESTPELSQEAFNYIKAHLKPNGHIYILGGTVAVPDQFLTALENLGFKRENMHRIAGYDRYETALAIAQELQHDGSEFYLVQGDNFPDALSASVLAATTGYVSVDKSNYFKAEGQTLPPSLGGIPLILVPSKGAIPDSIIQYLNSLPGDNTLKQTFHVVGGTAVIPEERLLQLKSQVKRLAPDGLTRISGDNRYGTMGQLNALTSNFNASWQNEGSGIPIPHIYLASGENFPDALTGAVLAAKNEAPLVLVNDLLPQETIDLLMGYFERNQRGIQQGAAVTALGGSSVISDKTMTVVSYILNYGGSITNQPSVQTLAGSGRLGYLDGQNQRAEFAMPSGIAEAKDGTVYVADTQNHRIRAISGGSVRTVAGATTAKDDYGMSVGGFQDGPATQALFNQPKGLVVDDGGTIFVADSANGAIRVIDKSGQVTTLVKGLKAPSDLVLGTKGDLYVTETLNHRILKVDRNGNWSVLAGGGYEMRNNWLFGGYADGQGEQARFNEPSGLALGPQGFLYVADTGNQRIRVVSPQGEVTTLAGSGSTPIVDTTYYKGGFQDGPGLNAQFHFPSGIAVSAEGTVYVADTYNHRLREISPLGVVKTLAGNGLHGKENGFPEQVQFDSPVAVKISREGDLLIVDQFNNLIRLLKW